MRKSKTTEALRVVTNTAAIQMALKKRGYKIRKQPILLSRPQIASCASPKGRRQGRTLLERDLSRRFVLKNTIYINS